MLASAAPQIDTVPDNGRRRPAMHSIELVLAVALNAGEPDDLAGADGERNVVDRSLAAVAQRRQAVDLQKPAPATDGPSTYRPAAARERPTIRLASCCGGDAFVRLGAR